MAGKKSKSTIPNWKKKKWYEIIAPPVFSDKVVGESMCYGPEDLMDKVIKVNLMNLSANSRKQNFNIKLRVTRVGDNKGFTKPIMLTMSQSHIKRLIKTGRDRIDMSFTATSKDGVLLRIKPLIIPRKATNKSVKVGALTKATEFLTDYIGKNNFEVVFSEVTKSNTQKELKAVLNKVYPMKLVEIRVVEVEKVKGIRALTKEDEKAQEEAIEAEEATEKIDENDSESEEETSEEEVTEEPVEETPEEEKPKKIEEEVRETEEETPAEDSEESEKAE